MCRSLPSGPWTLDQAILSSDQPEQVGCEPRSKFQRLWPPRRESRRRLPGQVRRVVSVDAVESAAAAHKPAQPSERATT